MIRIIAGTHRSRKLLVPETEAIRPTTDKAREALFSMLTHRLGTLESAWVCDAFCGTGAYGLEAISRGAERAFFLDLDRSALTLARRNAESLREGSKCSFVSANLTRPPAAPAPCHLLMLDPPYNKGLAESGLAALTAAGWATETALAAVEVARDETFTAPESWTIVTERNHGPARLIILERS